MPSAQCCAENFEWVVETAANYAIEKHRTKKDKIMTWGEYVKRRWR
jgi:hypothetical protein